MNENLISIFEGASINVVIDGKPRFATFHVFLDKPRQTIGIGLTYTTFLIMRNYLWATAKDLPSAWDLISALNILQTVYEISSEKYEPIIEECLKVAKKKSLGSYSPTLNEKINEKGVAVLTSQDANYRRVAKLLEVYRKVKREDIISAV